MRDILPAIRKILLDTPAIATAVDSGAIKRIFPGTLPQGAALPSIVLNQISEVDDYTMAGPSGLSAVRMQIDCWSKSRDQATVLGNYVHDALSGFAGTVTFDSERNPVAIRGIFVDQGRDDYDSIAILYSRRRDFLIWHAETGDASAAIPGVFTIGVSAIGGVDQIP